MYFYLKEPKSNKATPIILIYYIKGEKKYFKYPTGQKILPEEWDSTSRYPKLKRGGAGKKSKQISLVLDNYKGFLENTISNFEAKNNKIERAELKELFNKEFKYNYRKEDKNISSILSKGVDFYIETKKKNKSVSVNWINKYNNLRNKLILFDFYLGKDSIMSEVNENWLDSYCGFLRDFPNLVDRKKAKELKISISVNVKGYNDNSLHRHIKLLLTFFNWLKKNFKFDLIDLKNPIRDYDTDDVHLTDEEIQKIEEIKLSRESLERTRDVFLIGVYSGQRYSDYSIFEREDVIKTKKGEIIIKKAEKTERESFIPLHKKLKDLLEKYNWEIPSISTQKFNPHVKEICKEAEINEKVKKITYRGSQKDIEYYEKWELITSHTARRTFITLSSEKGMPDHIIMAITGIRDIKTLNKYKKTSQDSVFDYMNSTWG